MNNAESLNPTGIKGLGDPFILKAADGKFYMYATTFALRAKGFYCWESADMCTWSEGKPCYMVGERSFGANDYWAPEVVEYNGKYIMHYSARMPATNSLRVGVAVSDKPDGPFIDVYDKKPMFDFGYAAIDGHVFIDTDNKKYFYFSRDCSENIVNGRHESHIYGALLSDDLLSLKSIPQFLFAPSLPYETMRQVFDDNIEFVWNEGPFMLKKHGKYHLMYSANFYACKHYCICAALADNPFGPFKKYDKPVAVFIENRISGPGHNSVFTGKDGKLYCAYHVHSDYKKPSADRQMFIDAIGWENGLIKIIPTCRD